MSILSWLKGAIQSLFDRKDMAEKLQISLPAEKDMDEAVKLWAECYRDSPPWIVQNTDIVSMGLPYAVSHELARLVTLEFKSNLTGSPRAEFLDNHYSKVIDASPEWVEYACALGGVFLKPYVTDEGICVDYVQADAAIASEYSSSKEITGCIFVDRLTKGKKYYTRLEKHSLAGTNYTVINKAFISDDPSKIGREISLESVPEWAGITPSASFKGIKHPLFVYLGMPGANRVDRNSPLGVSVFNAALSAIEEADKQYTRMLWEFEGAELAVYASTMAIQRDSDGIESAPKFNKRLIKTLDFDDDNAFNVFSPAIRDASQLNGLNAQIRQVERLCGLAFGTFSDVQDSDKTATEIKASKQRSYATVSAIQNKLKKALTEYAEVLDILCDMYGLAPKGKLEQSFDFDDSLVTDSETEQKIWLQEVGSGLMTSVEYRMKRYGETEEQAAQMLPDAFGGDA
ncbi:MAG: phage portal protein [Huintestinicola sp.]